MFYIGHRISNKGGCDVIQKWVWYQWTGCDHLLCTMSHSLCVLHHTMTISMASNNICLCYIHLIWHQAQIYDKDTVGPMSDTGVWCDAWSRCDNINSVVWCDRVDAMSSAMQRMSNICRVWWHQHRVLWCHTYWIFCQKYRGYDITDILHVIPSM